MNPLNRINHILALLATLLIGQTAARADIRITATQVGGDVVFAYSGSINSASFSQSFPTTIRGTLAPQTSLIYFGPIEFSAPNTILYYTDAVTTSPVALGTGPATRCSSSTGDLFAITPNFLGLPNGYISGSPISGSTTYSSTTLETLGFNTSNGDYVWMLSNGQRVVFDLPGGSSVNLAKKLERLKEKLARAKKRGNRALVRRLADEVRRIKAELRNS